MLFFLFWLLLLKWCQKLFYFNRVLLFYMLDKKLQFGKVVGKTGCLLFLTIFIVLENRNIVQEWFFYIITY